MALTDNPFIGLPLQQQQDLQSAYIQVLFDIAQTGRSYAFPGLSLTRADMEQVNEMLRQLRMSIEYTTGQVRQIAQVVIDTQNNFNPATFIP